MRILDIHFENLNSLVGRWKIDFTHPQYTSDGIFAIVGPTGAGKTTILDAICLGLYGCTPRLGKMSASANEIMSRKTGNCFSEVSFETSNGRYRSHWAQRRSRQRADGELQQAFWELSRWDSATQSWEILASQINAVRAKIEEVTGMDYDRFTRSMMLAQGGFATFLLASPAERAPILEQITGTEIYSQISIHVHERKTLERKNLELIQKEMEGVPLLNQEERQQLQSAQEAYQAQWNQASIHLQGKRETQAWQERISKLKDDIANLQQRRLLSAEKLQQFQPQLNRLLLAQKALNLDGDYFGLEALRQQQKADEQEHAYNLQQLTKAEAALKEAQQLIPPYEQRLLEAKNVQEQGRKITNGVRILDAKIQETEKSIRQKDARAKQIDEELGAQEKRKAELRNQIHQLDEDIFAAEAFQKDHKEDESLAESLSGIRKTFEAAEHVAQEIRTLDETLAQAKKEEEGLEESWRDKDQAYQKHLQKHREAQKLEEQSEEQLLKSLEGRTAVSLQKALDQYIESHHLLNSLIPLMQRVSSTSESLADLRNHTETLKERMVQDAQALKSLSEEQRPLEEQIAQWEKDLYHRKKAHDLEEERQLLAEGQPCPLCGSLEHPYATVSIAGVDSAQKELDSKKTLLRQLLEKIEAFHRKTFQHETQLEHMEKDLKEKERQWKADRQEEEHLRNALQELTGKQIPAEIDKVQVYHHQVERLIQEEKDKIGEVHKSEEGLKKAQTITKKAAQAFEHARDQIQQIEHQRSGLKQRISTQSEHRNLRILTWEKSIEEMTHAVSPYGFAEENLHDPLSVLSQLDKRSFSWQKNRKRWEESRSQREGARHRLESLEETRRKTTQDRETLWQQIQEESKEKTTMVHERQKRFGDRDCDHQEIEWKEAVDIAVDALERATRQKNQHSEKYQQLTAQLESCAQRIENRKPQLRTETDTFSLRLKTEGFSSEEAYLEARMAYEERLSLQQKGERLKQEHAELQSLLNQLQSQLEMEQGHNRQHIPMDLLKEQLEALEDQMKSLQQSQGATTQRLEEDRKHQEVFAKIQIRLENQKRETTRWDRLHELIGSADGKKFRNFAQGLTFEMMIHHANQQLQKMTDRYLLIHDPDTPLVLNVIDQYQSGEVRSTKNLSGGESFLVSLALALGLSQMSSRRVRVDSLFLDEGFGTLDEEALEVALGTLSSLQQEGKLIGVISHVSALKERIPTQIQVIPDHAGKSILKGPAVQRLSAK